MAWKTPNSLIECTSSWNGSSSKTLRGWDGFGLIELTSRCAMRAPGTATSCELASALACEAAARFASALPGPAPAPKKTSIGRSFAERSAFDESPVERSTFAGALGIKAPMPLPRPTFLSAILRSSESDFDRGFHVGNRAG